MELLYLWIEDYKNIKHQGFNFSSEYQFNFKVEDSYIINKGRQYETEITVKGSLILEDKKEKASIFGNQIHVNAVVGKNGVGKSTFAEFLTLFLGHYDRLGVWSRDVQINRYRGILVYKENEEVCVMETLSKNKLIKNKNTIEPINFTLKLIACDLKKRRLSNYKSVIYNPFLGSSIEREGSYNNVINLSSGRAIFKAIRSFIRKENKIILEGVNACETIEEAKRSLKDEFYYEKDYEFFGSLKYHLGVKEITQIFKYLLLNKNKPNSKLNFQYFRLIVRDIDYKELNVNYKELDIDIFSALEKYRLDLGLSGFDSFIIFFLKRLLYNWMTGIDSSFNFENPYEDKFTNFNKLIVEIKRLIDEKKLNIDEVLSFLNKIDYDITDLSIVQKILLFMKSKKEEALDNSYNSACFVISEEWIDLLNSIVSSFSFSQVFDFTIVPKPYIYSADLSSGEKQLLTLFSRLYEQAKGDLKQEKNLIIVLDEVEVGLHPQWQKELVKDLLEGIQLIFPDKNIHLIITTHSPFILSDIPKSNVIFLDRFDDNDREVLDKKQNAGACKVLKGNALNKVNDTFGANIYTMLSDSFFMTDGAMGEFAKEKINQVIKLLNTYLVENKKDDNSENGMTMGEAKMIISMIGEPFLRKKLESMYYQVNPEEELEDLEKRRNEIDKRIKKLKEKR